MGCGMGRERWGEEEADGWMGDMRKESGEDGGALTWMTGIQ